MSLGDWFSVSRKGETREVGWYIHPRVKAAGLCVGLAVKSFSRVIVQIGPGNQSSHLKGQCLSNLITNVLRTTECNHTCSLEQEKQVWLYKLNV